MKNITPLGNRILVEPVVEEKTKGGIYLPDSAKDKPQEATVLAVGTGRLTDRLERVPFDMKVGDRVFLMKGRGAEVEHDGKACKLISVDDVLAVMEA